MTNDKKPKDPCIAIRLTWEEWDRLQELFAKYPGIKAATFAKEALFEKVDRLNKPQDEVKGIKAAFTGAPLEDAFIRDTVKAINHLKDRVDGHDEAFSELEELLKKAGCPDFRRHDCRHTFATWLYCKTGDILKVKEALGHRDIKSTIRYTHFPSEDVKASFAIIESIIENVA